MAEIELAVLAGQCLDRRLADQVTLQREITAWEATRNAARHGVDWRFTTETPASSSSTSTQQFKADELLVQLRVSCWHMMAARLRDEEPPHADRPAAGDHR
jgi:hypothetical protein